MSATLQMHDGTPTAFVDGQPVFLSYLWMAGPTKDAYAHADTTKAYARAGIHAHAFDVGTQAREPEWCGPGPGRDVDWDFSTLRARYGRILDANPDALFHLRIYMRMPEWWQRLYPEECEVASIGRVGGSTAQSFASRPVFHLEDPEARVPGQVVFSEGRCRPGLGVKELDGWRSVYIAAPNVPAPVLRGLARYAGVHLYSEDGDVLYATPDLLAVHTVAGGERHFRLPRRVEVVQDLFAGREVAGDTDVIDTRLAPASTSLYYTSRSMSRV